MTERPEEANGAAQAQIRVTALSSTMFYTAGRIDAADRKAGTVVALSLGILGISVGTGAIDIGAADRPLMAAVFSKVSIVLALISLSLSLLGVWAREAKGDDWVSQNFLGTKTVNEVSKSIAKSDDVVIEGMISSQQTLSALVRRKNRITNMSILVLVFATAFFGIGL